MTTLSCYRIEILKSRIFQDSVLKTQANNRNLPSSHDDPVRRIREPTRRCRPGEPGGAGEVLLEGDGQEKREKLGLGDSKRSLYSSAARVKLQQPDSCYAKFSE